MPTRSKGRDDTKAFLTVGEFADRMNRSSETIRRWMREGHINVVRIGSSRPMIPATEIDRLAATAGPRDAR